MLSDKLLAILIVDYTESSFSSRAQVFVLAQACRTLAPLRGNKPNARYGAATCLKQPPASSPTWRGCRRYQRRRRMPRDCKKIASALALNLYLHVSGAPLRTLDSSGLFSTTFSWEIVSIAKVR